MRPGQPSVGTEGVGAIDSTLRPSGLPSAAPPTAHRVRSVLAIPAFRRLWLVTAVSATGDWLSLLALSALATQLATGYQAQSFALGGVVATKLLPALVLGPLAGALADKFDRRRVMVVCDLLRFGLFLSIPLVGSLWWLLVATLLIEICALFWIPAKDASVPNLLRRPDQIETANQLALVMTYGVAVITASGLFTVISGLGRFLPGTTPEISTAYVALFLNGLAYLLTATTVWFRIREISGRADQRREAAPGLVALLRDGARFVASTPLVRGLVIGIIGAFTAGGIVVGSATLYAASLGGGNAAYGMLFIAVFVGLAIGMGAAPQLSRRLPHNRLFGTAIVAAGCALVLVALAPHLTVAIGAVGLVGGFAGIAFLTGLTIIGAQVADEVRGRIVAFVQSIVRLTLLGSMALVPLIVGLVSARDVEVFGYPYRIDGTRVVMLAGGVIAAVVGMLAYRQMDDRRTEPLLPDLLAALRRGVRRSGSGVLIAIEGATARETAEQARRLVGTLRDRGHRVVVAGPEQLRAEPVAASGSLAGPRAGALAEAAARADLVERVVRPALADGAVVVADRFLASPLVQLGVTAELDARELESLTAFATGRLRPDVSVLLDRAPAPPPTESDIPAGDDTTPIPMLPGEEHVRVRRLLTRMAAAEPHRYVVVEAEGTPDDVAGRVLAALAPVLPDPPAERGAGSRVPAAGPATVASGSPTSAGSVTPVDERPGPSTGAGSDTAADRRTADTVPVGRPTDAPAAGRPTTDTATEPTASGTVTVVDDDKIAVTGAKPALLRLRHRRRRS